ncbi:MAG TPA: hypothetical protein VNE16_10390 [Vicinamibacterales bacterium]|nr:hypothetical protein [Vicinamibacterales bacterium]
MTAFAEIARKLDADDPLSDADALDLASTQDLVGLAELADRARRRRHGTQTTFVRVAEVSLAGPLPDLPGDAGEWCLRGAPATLESAQARVQQLVARAGEVPVSAFSLADLEALAADEGLSLRALLERLREAGLELVAEAPVDDLQDARASIEAANMSGLTVARLTFGGEPRGSFVRALRDVAALQRQVGVLRVFQPLPRAVVAGQPTTGYADVRQVALARLLVDNIDTIQVDWLVYGPKLAQVALTAGADDLDRVPPAAGPVPEGRRNPRDEVRWNIEATGQQPVERNGRFDLLG